MEKKKYGVKKPGKSSSRHKKTNDFLTYFNYFLLEPEKIQTEQTEEKNENTIEEKLEEGINSQINVKGDSKEITKNNEMIAETEEKKNEKANDSEEKKEGDEKVPKRRRRRTRRKKQTNVEAEAVTIPENKSVKVEEKEEKTATVLGVQQKTIRKKRGRKEKAKTIKPEETVSIPNIKEETKTELTEKLEDIPQKTQIEEKILETEKNISPEKALVSSPKESAQNPLKEETVALKQESMEIEEKKEKNEETASVFKDLELPIYPNFLENEDYDRIFPKALWYLPANLLHGRLAKIIKTGNEKTMVITKYIKKKQKNQKNLCFFSDNSSLNLDEEMILVMQEPCFCQIDSKEKFAKVFDQGALQHFQEGFENLADFYNKNLGSSAQKTIWWPVLLFQNFGKKDAITFIINQNKIFDDLYLNLENTNKEQTVFVEEIQSYLNYYYIFNFLQLLLLLL